MKKLLIINLLLSIFILTACRPVENDYNKPLSYWAARKLPTDPDPCVYKTAQAIIASGLPYPNITTKEVVDSKGNKKTVNDTVDVWVNTTRLVIPAEFMRINDLYGTNHPYRYHKMGGSLPNFYPKGNPGPEIDGMGSMVDIKIHCSFKEQFFDRKEIFDKWDEKSSMTREEDIAKSIYYYEKYYKGNSTRGKVTRSVRKDLNMIEVLYDEERTDRDGQPIWEASYWPLKEGEWLEGLDGQINGIYCTRIRHDIEKRYSKVGWTCGSNFRITSNKDSDITIGISIYVSQIRHMPSIYKQVKQLFITAQKNGQLNTNHSIITPTGK